MFYSFRCLCEFLIFKVFLLILTLLMSVVPSQLTLYSSINNLSVCLAAPPPTTSSINDRHQHLSLRRRRRNTIHLKSSHSTICLLVVACPVFCFQFCSQFLLFIINAHKYTFLLFVYFFDVTLRQVININSFFLIGIFDFFYFFYFLL